MSLSRMSLCHFEGDTGTLLKERTLLNEIESIESPHVTLKDVTLSQELSLTRLNPLNHLMSL